MSKEKKVSYDDVHWADFSAKRVIETFPNEKVYVVASGITPSGTVHIGNFREVITTEFVRRGLERKGKKTKFIYSWDIYDAFRKVPKNVPKEWEKYLRMSDGDVPDPWGCHKSYAKHFTEPMEKEVLALKFPVEFQYQDELFKSGIYADKIKFLFENRDKVVEILNEHKDKNKLDKKSWWPGYVYCNSCRKDTTKIKNYLGGYELEYECECGNSEKVDFKKTPCVGLFWRVDWPMRWDFYDVVFEPGGKDHSTPGGSYDTGSSIVRGLFKREPPVYTAYNFVGLKGQNGKISSSSGNGVSVSDVLKVYTKELLLFLFAGTRPNAEFDISFDLDVIKIYEDFDSLERVYFGVDEEKNEKKLATKKRIYELSMVDEKDIQKSLPFQPSFRHLTTIAQANNFNEEKILDFFADEIKTDFDKKRLLERLECVKNWLGEFAPDEMKFKICDSIDFELSESEKNILGDVKKVLEKAKSGEELFASFRDICEKRGISVRDFFKFMYKVTIGKDRGPKLADFMIENKEKFLILFGKI